MPHLEQLLGVVAAAALYRQQRIRDELRGLRAGRRALLPLWWCSVSHHVSVVAHPQPPRQHGAAGPFGLLVRQASAVRLRAALVPPVVVVVVVVVVVGVRGVRRRRVWRRRWRRRWRRTVHGDAVELRSARDTRVLMGFVVHEAVPRRTIHLHASGGACITINGIHHRIVDLYNDAVARPRSELGSSLRPRTALQGEPAASDAEAAGGDRHSAHD
jgi:hypothetical protein